MTLSEIQQSFYSRTFDIEAISNLLAGVAIIAVLIIAYLIFTTIRGRRIRYKPHGSVTDEKQIWEIFHKAFEQRRPFEVQIQADAGRRRPTIRCSPEYMGQHSLTVEINGLHKLSDRWLNRAVMVFFRVRIGKLFTYYTFASRIGSIHMPRQGVCHITLPLPSSLENRQKRAFLRITPPHDLILGAALWSGKNMPEPELLTEITNWPQPTLLFLPNQIQQVHLLDISAGGIRLSIANPVVRGHNLEFFLTEQLIIMLDLFAPEQDKRLRFWLLCRIQNIWREYASRDIHIGLQFKAWGRPKEVADYGEQAGGIEWLRLSPSLEVEPMGNWIMRRHLELFREASPEDELEERATT